MTKIFLDDIDNRDHAFGAFLTVTPELALEMADRADQKIKQGEISPLAGIPIAIKDIIHVRGVRTTAGSKILRNFVAPYDATVTEKLRDTGAVFLGKTNCDEFAMGSSNENSAYEVVRNPWNLKCVPGGSSGGSAAAVSSREAPAALGTDTGGSIRQPAALCGIVGLKPTYGRVSRYGVVAFASSLDQVGPMTRRVEDSALVFETIAGHDPHESTSARVTMEPPRGKIGQSIQGLRIGYPKEFLPEGLSKEVRENFTKALRDFEKLGATVVEISLPHTEYAIACYYIVATAEASSNLARYDGVRYGHRSDKSNDMTELFVRSRTEGFGKEVQRRILLGTFVLSSGYYDAYYLKGQKVRTLIRNDFAKAFEKVDVILSPTSPTPAFKIGSRSSNPLEMYLSDIFTVSTPLAGLPALAVPSGFSATGLPLGIQLIGKAFDESTLFQVGHAYETETRYFERKPPA